MKRNNTAGGTIAKYFFAFALVFGFYLMSHGAVSHGAGIAGGVIIVLGFIQAQLILGKEGTSGIINRANARLAAVISTAILLLISITDYFYGGSFMYNIADTGSRFTVLGAGISVMYNITICFCVIGCIGFIYLSIFERDKG
jgi:Domain related to MnhB subunit of Na+/H+ antiporter